MITFLAITGGIWWLSVIVMGISVMGASMAPDSWDEYSDADLDQGR